MATTMKVLYKFRFSRTDSETAGRKNISVILDASCKVLDGLEVAFEKLTEDAAQWTIVSVRHFDEDFGEHVDITDDDVVEGLAKYEVDLEPCHTEQTQTEGRLEVRYLTGESLIVSLLPR